MATFYCNQIKDHITWHILNNTMRKSCMLQLVSCNLVRSENMLRHCNSRCMYSTKSPLRQCDFALKLNGYYVKT